MKNNWKGRTGFKIAALVVAVITALTTMLGAGMMLLCIGFRGEFGNHPDVMAEKLQGQMVSHYAAYLVEQVKEDKYEAWEKLEGSSLTYAVEQITFDVAGEGEAIRVDRNNQFVYGEQSLIDWLQAGGGAEKGVYQVVISAADTYNYDVTSWQTMVFQEVYRYTMDKAFYLSENAGGDVLQYFDYTDEDGEDVEDISEPVEDILVDREEMTDYVNESQTNEATLSNDAENEGNSAEGLLKGNVPPAGTYTFYRIYMIPNVEDVLEKTGDMEQYAGESWLREDYDQVARTVVGHGSYVSGKEILDSANPINLFMIIYHLQTDADSVSFTSGLSDYLWIPYVLTGMLQTMQRIYLPFFLISLILFMIAFGLLMTMSGHRKNDNEIHLRPADRIPYAIYGCGAVIGVMLGILGDMGIVYLFSTNNLQMGEMITLAIADAILWELLAFAFCMSTATRIKSKKFWDYTVLHYIAAFIRRWLLDPIKNIKRMIQENVNLSVRLAVGLLILGLVELFVLAAVGMMSPGFFFFFLYKIVETFVIYYLVFMAKKLKDGGKRVANGNYNEPIDTTHMIAPMREHGEDINHVGEGIAIAVEEQMKSERLKTELITNVSHDIKTPLTSIINYVDLIKKENVSEPTVREYVDVLDRQSARLKKLIEDLLEASKASTGNVEMHMEACDAIVMISQIVGEYQEKLQKKNIDIVVNESEVPANIMADGRHLWRVFDNIMTNICKYTQEHTRVYVDVTDAGDEVNMTFKNISKYPLNITSDELMERFVRGDASRNTEGHGLGLSIAQSLTELMGGQLSIAIDGDLFKITVAMKKQA